MPNHSPKDKALLPDYGSSPLSNLYYLNSVEDWFAGFASFVKQPPRNPSGMSASSIDDLLFSKVESLQTQEKSVESFIQERKNLERKIISKLEEIISRCKEYLRPLLATQPIIHDLGLKLEQEVIQCEKDILHEFLDSFHDRLELEKMLWKIRDDSQSAKRRYRLVKDI